MAKAALSLATFLPIRVQLLAHGCECLNICFGYIQFILFMDVENTLHPSPAPPLSSQSAHQNSCLWEFSLPQSGCTTKGDFMEKTGHPSKCCWREEPITTHRPTWKDGCMTRFGLKLLAWIGLSWACSIWRPWHRRPWCSLQHICCHSQSSSLLIDICRPYSACRARHFSQSSSLALEPVAVCRVRC